MRDSALRISRHAGRQLKLVERSTLRILLLVSFPSALYTNVPCMPDRPVEAWWTGPLAAPSAATLPKGHFLIEPYVYGTHTRGEYGATGKIDDTSRATTAGALIYALYGIRDRFSSGLVYTGELDGARQEYPASYALGDISVVAQFGIILPKPCRSSPAVSANVQESFPTGQYDGLPDAHSAALGSGAFTTTFSLYTQSSLWLPNGRILRIRLNSSVSASSTAMISGESVYGTVNGFVGHAEPGKGAVVDLAGEYSFNRNWVLASDLLYQYRAQTKVIADMSSSQSAPTANGSSALVVVVPAVEYNFSSRVGVIAGVRASTWGRNTAATLSPVFAINYVH